MTLRAARWRSLFLAVERRITQAAVAAGCLGLVVASLVGLYQVVARFVLFRPAAWSEPLIQVVFIWMAYLALAGAMRTGTLISVDALRTVLAQGPYKRLLDTVIMLSTMALLGVLLWFGSVLVWRVRFQTIAGLDMAASWAYAALPVGAVLSMLALIAHFLDPKTHADVPADAAG
ncbi:TRAP transporter small permease [Azospirillum sp. ST 5-10]|uniref:TRAP transporter small permease n=1 Tax=unclassified Azospirillum TaxID=2630922 RepID=UPI003F4A7109